METNQWQIRSDTNISKPHSAENAKGAHGFLPNVRRPLFLRVLLAVWIRIPRAVADADDRFFKSDRGTLGGVTVVKARFWDSFKDSGSL